MKERLLDVIKWSLILVVAGMVFYVVCPKYHFMENDIGLVVCRGNKITGEVESTTGRTWKPGGITWKKK